jgi:hypothetical protein
MSSPFNLHVPECISVLSVPCNTLQYFGIADDFLDIIIRKDISITPINRTSVIKSKC